MLDIDYLFSEDKDVIIAVLVEKIRDQTCDLENVTERAETSALELKSAKTAIDRLEIELAAAKKAAKALKAPKALDLPIVKSVKVIRGDLPKVAKGEAPAPKNKGGRPKKVVTEAPAKRKPGRPKKVVG
jgi:hypothetical protein